VPVSRKRANLKFVPRGEFGFLRSLENGFLIPLLLQRGGMTHRFDSNERMKSLRLFRELAMSLPPCVEFTFGRI